MILLQAKHILQTLIVQYKPHGPYARFIGISKSRRTSQRHDSIHAASRLESIRSNP